MSDIEMEVKIKCNHCGSWTPEDSESCESCDQDPKEEVTPKLEPFQAELFECDGVFCEWCSDFFPGETIVEHAVNYHEIWDEIRYQCPFCGAFHTDSDYAMNYCCGEAWHCPYCETLYDNHEDAEICCEGDS